MKVILVDDERSMLLILKKMIAKVLDVEVIGTFQSPGEAYNFLKNNKIDMVFVDIKMPEESGLDFARRVISELNDIYLVFLTSYKEHALEAFDVQAFDYIVKPLSQERLERTLNRAMLQRSCMTSDSSREISMLSVYGLGGLDIRYRDGEFVQLNSSKSTELFAYLLLNRGKFISKWRVIEDVFRGMLPRNAETYLNTTVYKLRKALEPCGMRAAVVFANESYRLDIKDIYADFFDFQDRVNAMCSINETNIEDAIKTKRLFAGELFGDKDYQWSLSEKERLLDMYFVFAKRLGRYLMKNNLTLALQVFKELAAKNELDEEVHCCLMQIYAELKDKASLIRQFERYEQVLQRELEIAPGNAAKNLFISLKEFLD